MNPHPREIDDLIGNLHRRCDELQVKVDRLPSIGTCYVAFMALFVATYVAAALLICLLR
jgi:hypothetical protein